MKKLIFLYILLSFITIALFGFTGFLDHHSAFADCARTLTGAKMPPCSSDGSIAMGLSHAQIYHNFFLAVIVLSALLFTVALALLGSFAPASSDHSNKVSKYLSDFVPASQEKILKWFNILQHSDPRLNF